MNKGWIQFIIGLILALFGIYQVYESTIIGNVFAEGVLIGQGCVFLLWGIRELIGSGFKGSKEVKKE